MPKPPEKEDKLLTWPNWPLKLRTSSSHEEGAERDFAVMTQKFTGQHGQVQKLRMRALSTTSSSRSPAPNSTLKADLVLLAMGFVHPVHEGMIKALGLELDPRGNVKADTESYQTSNPQDVHRRRHAARAVAGRVGDPRRPSGRARGRQVPDGRDQPAALTAGFCE